MQRRESTVWEGPPRRPEGTMAAVGQASIQRVHEPQRPGGGASGFDLQRNQQLTQKEPRAHALVDQAGVLSDPAESRASGVSALHQGSCIDADLPLKGLRAGGREFPGQTLEGRADHAVVVLAPGIAGDPSPAALAELDRIRLRAIVELAHDRGWTWPRGAARADRGASRPGGRPGTTFRRPCPGRPIRDTTPPRAAGPPEPRRPARSRTRAPAA